MVLNKADKQEIIRHLVSQVKNENFSPSILLFCLTSRCQLNCRYCDMGRISPVREMSLSTLKRGIDLLSTSKTDVITFQISGGEPLLKWDLMKKGVEYFREKTKKLDKSKEVSLTTNGLLLTAEKIDFFKKKKVDFDVVFAFDGEKKSQNLNRPAFQKKSVKNYSDIILKNLDGLIASGTDFVVNMVVRPENLVDLEENVDLLVKRGVKSLIVSYAMSVFWKEKDIENFFSVVSKLFFKYKNLLLGSEHCEVDEPMITSCALTLTPEEEIVVGPTYPLLEFFPHIKEINSYGRLNDYQNFSQIKRNKRKEINKSLEILSRKDNREFFLWANNIYMGILYRNLFRKLENNIK